MGFFKKTPSQKIASSQKKVAQYEVKKENLIFKDYDPDKARKKENKINVKIAKQKGIQRGAELELKHPAPLVKKTNTKINIAKTQINVEKPSKRK